MAIGVVIVAYRSSGSIAECVLSCLADASVAAVVVHDNSSDPVTAQLVREISAADSRVTYLASANVGYASACNRGSKMVIDGVDYIAIVNPDVVLAVPLADLAAVYEHLPVAPTLIGGDVVPVRETHILSARPMVSLRRELVRAVIGNVAYRMRAPQFRGVARVGQISGALMLIPVEEFKAMSGFDERFELYYEDVDLCARANERGGCLLDSRLYGIHAGGASSGQVSPMAYSALGISRIRYLRKHHDHWWLNAYLIALAVIEFTARTIARRAEGDSARLQGLRTQLRELRLPNSVKVLT